MDGSSSGEYEVGEMQWSPHKVVHCAKAVGVTVEDSNGGWNPLVEFVQRWERLNQEEKRGMKYKRKGIRELKSLSCSINYDKAKAKEDEEKSLGTEEGRIQEAFYSSK